MTRSRTTTVAYPTGDIVWGNFYVDQLADSYAVAQTAPEIRELIRRAYAWAYEVPNGSLPIGTLATRYGARHNQRFQDTAVEHFERGSQYWIARSEGSNSQLLGFAKTSPGEVVGRPGTVYLNDVVVDPRPRPGSSITSQRRGYGKMLVHTALKYGGYEDLPLVLEAFEASEGAMNQLYVGMGLRRGTEAEPFEFPNGTSLPMVEYVSDPGLTLNGVVQAMERRNWLLQHAYASTVVHRA